VLEYSVISKAILHELNKRIEFTYQVGDQVGQVWDEFLKTQEGQAFEWREDDAPDVFGRAKGTIRIKPSEKQTEKGSVCIFLKSSGKVNLSISEWELNDLGGWDEDSEEVEITIDLREGPEAATAQILSVMISSGSRFGNLFRRFVEASWSNGVTCELRPDFE